MSKHYIYEIFGRKIGATNDVERRMKEQKVKEGEYRIIEEHTNAKTCSIREIELQKEFNYPVDRIQYWKTLKMQKKCSTPEVRKKAVANTDYKAKVANTDFQEFQARKVASRDWEKYSQIMSKPVNQYDLQGNFIKRWDSQTEATKTLKIYYQSIGHCCRGTQKTAHKFIWKYEN